MEPNVVTVSTSTLPAAPYAKSFPDISKIEDTNRRELKAAKGKELTTRANLVQGKVHKSNRKKVINDNPPKPKVNLVEGDDIIAAWEKEKNMCIWVILGLQVTLFLNGDLEEEIYMVQPNDCIVSGQENKVCKLLRSLYGLKQAPKQWHEKFDQVLLNDGFIFVEVDKCLRYSCKSKTFLASKFDMKDVGEANIILGVRIIRKNDSPMLSQEHYVEKLLRNFGHFNVKPVCTLYDPNCQLKKIRGDFVAQSEYAHIIGSLLHLVNFSSTPSVSVCCDCQAAIAIAKNKTFNGKNRHIRLRHNVVKQLLKDETISIDYVKSEVNLANSLTKPFREKTNR
ncbi:uncharacterized protein LOC122722409 [Manihot esculenta]|uniref:uncharacterized protein LOC122722409 n=1 Tax=Manihot esculenta TaxID=3983 RepID=UPI001CC74EDA|nr:uncharacterized protein LOC122722409 [Manihot esculenta]